MPRGELNPIRKEMPLLEIEKRIKDLEKNTKVLKRLYFIKFRYQGRRVERAANDVGITKKLGYIWQERWNMEGFDGLIPRYAGGRPSRLTEEQRESLMRMLEKRNDWSTREVFLLIKGRYGTEYSMKHIRELLGRFGMKYSRPFPHD